MSTVEGVLTIKLNQALHHQEEARSRSDDPATDGQFSQFKGRDRVTDISRIEQENRNFRLKNEVSSTTSAIVAKMLLFFSGCLFHQLLIAAAWQILEQKLSYYERPGGIVEQLRRAEQKADLRERLAQERLVEVENKFKEQQNAHEVGKGKETSRIDINLPHSTSNMKEETAREACGDSEQISAGGTCFLFLLGCFAINFTDSE
jgi:hypothetical protein